MATISRTILLLTILLFPAAIYGQAEDALPRVLILGDSVYRQPAADAAKELKGRVHVVYVSTQSGEVFNTTSALERLDALLGERTWDVIHFNVGLGDLVYRAPAMRSFRILPIHAGGVRANSPEQYERNLRELVARFKATGAKLIWASTTPIRHSSSNVFEMQSEVQYNAIAANVMADEHVRVNDMYAYLFEKMDMSRPASHGADPFFFDRIPLQPPIVQSILDELDQK
ncbi:MAG: SGNH/GDSL hydrolase family protein [Planctomycetales bacterium]|nr:SGNH/GDSL hydrolase family protein [Planctomycetales bacterium]